MDWIEIGISAAFAIRKEYFLIFQFYSISISFFLTFALLKRTQLNGIIFLFMLILQCLVVSTKSALSLPLLTFTLNIFGGSGFSRLLSNPKFVQLLIYLNGFAQRLVI